MLIGWLIDWFLLYNLLIFIASHYLALIFFCAKTIFDFGIFYHAGIGPGNVQATDHVQEVRPRGI